MENTTSAILPQEIGRFHERSFALQKEEDIVKGTRMRGG